MTASAGITAPTALTKAAVLSRCIRPREMAKVRIDRAGNHLAAVGFGEFRRHVAEFDYLGRTCIARVDNSQ